MHTKVDIGQKIKEVFDGRKMKLTDFADQLGTVRQNVYRIFKKRHVDTGLLLKISEVLDHNFFQYYLPVEPTPASEADNVVLKARIQETLNQLDLAKREIEYLRKIIKLMDEKIPLVKELTNDVIIR